MESFTLRGFADPGDMAPEPVFPLRRLRPHPHSRRVTARTDFEAPRPFDLRMPLPSTWPFGREWDWREFEWTDGEVDEWDDDSRTVPRGVSSRTVAARIVGFVVVSLALFGCGTVLARPQVTHEVLDWVTLGHADGVTAGVEHLRAAVRAFAADR
jgi:hypothetical protein